MAYRTRYCKRSCTGNKLHIKQTQRRKSYQVALRSVFEMLFVIWVTTLQPKTIHIYETRAPPTSTMSESELGLGVRLRFLDFGFSVKYLLDDCAEAAACASSLSRSTCSTKGLSRSSSMGESRYRCKARRTWQDSMPSPHPPRQGFFADGPREFGVDIAGIRPL